MEKKLDGNYTRIAASDIEQVMEAALHKALHHPSRKLSKLDEPDTWDTAGEVGVIS